jgi:hypothetical protein
VSGKLKLLAMGAGTLLVLLAGVTTVYYLSFGPPVLSFKPKDVPAITASPMDVDRIIDLSPFRSGIGHDFSERAWDGETCRSMKHYFNFSQNMVNGLPVRSTPGPGESNIKVYAPFDATIMRIDEEQVKIGRQVWLASAQDAAYKLRFFHIDLKPGLGVGSKVASGQVIGTIGPRDGMDVSYEVNLVGGKIVYLSIFDYMTDRAFAPYAALGYKRSDFVLTRAQADANGYQCNGEQFVNQAQGPRNGGYLEIHRNPYARQYGNGGSSSAPALRDTHQVRA